MDARTVQYRATRGLLHRVHRGVYAVGHPRLSTDGLRMAAVLACGPRAALSHRAAAAVWGMRPTARERLEVTTTDRGRRGPPGVELHRVRRLSRLDLTRHRGIPITSVARTLVDLAELLDADELAKAVHEAEVLRLLDVTSVEAAMARANGRRGIAMLRAALADPAPALTRSELERQFILLCRRTRLPIPKVNVSLTVGDRRIEVDTLWASERVIVELDGERPHYTRRAFHADRRRDAGLAAEGYVVVRLTWERIAREPDQVVAELHRLLAVRRSP
jgi:very-short-patch-repair endonuclease